MWHHLRSLLDSKIDLSARSDGLYLLKKLSKEHLDLTSFSRMRVDLAVEVIQFAKILLYARQALFCTGPE